MQVEKKIKCESSSIVHFSSSSSDNVVTATYDITAVVKGLPADIGILVKFANNLVKFQFDALIVGDC